MMESLRHNAHQQEKTEAQGGIKQTSATVSFKKRDLTPGTVNDFVHRSFLVQRFCVRRIVLRVHLPSRPTPALLLPTSNPCQARSTCHHPQETIPRSVCAPSKAMLHVSSIALLNVSLNLVVNLRLRFVRAENNTRDHWRGHGTSISRRRASRMRFCFKVPVVSVIQSWSHRNIQSPNLRFQ